MSDRDEWDRLLDAIHSGLVHALSGRVHGLSGIIEIGTMRGSLEYELKLLLEDERARLEQIAAGVRALPPVRAEASTATLHDVVHAALEVNRLRHPGTIHVAIDRPGVGVVADSAELTRCLVMLIAAVQASLTERGASLALSAQLFDEEVVIQLHAAGDAEPGAPDADLLRAARSSAQRLGAVLTEAADSSIELRLRSAV